MTLTTFVTPADVAVALGRSTPDASDPAYLQWEMWIADALMWINERADRLEVTTVDQGRLDYVVREAVKAHALRPDNATQVTVSVDDASTSKTYRSSTGRVSILDEWWALLGLAGVRGRAFELDTMPADGGLAFDEERLWVPLSWDAP